MYRRSVQSSQCGCCHIKTGTSAYLLVHLVAAFFIIVVAVLGLTGLVDVESINSFHCHRAEFSTHQALFILLGNGLFWCLMSSLAIFGIGKNRAGFLLPFFIIQLFDFLCTLVYVGRLIFTWPSLKQSILTCKCMPEEWKEQLFSVDDRWFALIMFVVVTGVIIVKLYLVSVIYRCYQFITVQGIMRQRQQHEINFIATDLPKDEKRPSIYNPPKYEDIQKMPLVDDMEETDVKPPPYEQV